MFNYRSIKKPSHFDQEIDNVLDQLENIPATSDDYATAVKNLEVLCKASSSKSTRAVSPDVIVTVLANLAGIVMVLGYERANVITSKALGFIVKPRI